MESVPDDDELDDGLTDEELLQMWERYVADGRPETGRLREKLIEHYYPLCAKVAGKVAQRLPQHVDRDDLMSWAALGLLRAVKHYDPALRPVKNSAGKIVMGRANFKTYSMASMNGVILDEIRKLDWAPRSLRKKQRDIDKCRLELASSMGCKPTDLQVADFLGIPVLTLRITEQETAASWHAYLEENEDANEMVSGPVGEELAVTAQLRRALVKEYNLLPMLVQAVIALAYFEEKKMCEVAEALGLTESQAGQLHKHGIERLTRAMVGSLDEELLEYVGA